MFYLCVLLLYKSWSYACFLVIPLGMVLGRLSTRMSLDDLTKLIFNNNPKLVAIMEAGGLELGCTVVLVVLP